MNPLEVSAEEFSKVASHLTQLAAAYLSEMNRMPCFPAASGTEAEALFHQPAPENGMRMQALESLPDVARLSRVQNSRFFGYVLGSGEPIAAAADLLASVLNQNTTAWRSCPAAVTIERTVVEWLAEAIGCPGFRGSLTGGGSSANLMGLAMAREAKLAANDDGLNSASDAVFYASEQVHMSIPKAIALLGIGRRNLKLIPADEADRMIVSKLDDAIAADKQAGKMPVAIIASAGTVNTGAIDPFQDIARVARQHKIWLHVDGAYGALAAMAVPEKFAGLDLADSLSLDPHKWLYQPLDCGCLLYRDVAAAQNAFSHTGDYAKVLNSDPIESFAFFEESMELSRRFRALKLWLSIRYHGMAAFRESIRQNLKLTQRLAAGVASNGKLELMAPVELSAVCFRCKAAGSNDEVDQFNASLLKRVIERGRVYLSNATIRGKFCLRACIVNHRTTEADVDAVIEEVLAAM
jgi:glutamate/tyrosine decarboxylase-like PLP-dependent enzyme